jgi:hypothetical protein
VPVRVPPDVDAYARIVIDRGPGTHLEWVCHIPDGPNAGASFTFLNPEIRFNTSLTEGWLSVRPFTEEEMARWAFLGGDA